jgi:hypothetical protein
MRFRVFSFRRRSLAFRVIICSGFSTAFDEDMSLQGVLARETLVAVVTRERLNSKMYPLMPLQIVVPVEALRTLVALERAVVGSRLLVLRVAHEMRHSGRMARVEAWDHGWVASDQGKAAVWVLDVGEDGGLAAGVLE